MFGPSEFRELVSGRRVGPVAMALRGLLRVVEVPYSMAMRLRNWRFDHRRAAIHRADVPVVSVGNMTLGGTGKTPMVEWIAWQLGERGIRLAIVSRGYRACADGRNDEALELALAHPEVPHLQNPDRFAAAQAAVERHNAKLVLLDDGFQHRRLARDLDIVLLDASEPFGYDHVFPRGMLRESLTGLARAQVVVLSRADMLDESSRAAVRARAMTFAPSATWCEVVHQPQSLLASDGKTTPLSELAGQRVAAFCGIGNPNGFRHTLTALDVQLGAWREFPDHHTYQSNDLESLAAWADRFDLILCTRKDLVKLGRDELGGIPLRALGIELKFLVGEQAMNERLAAIAEQVASI